MKFLPLFAFTVLSVSSLSAAPEAKPDAAKDAVLLPTPFRTFTSPDGKKIEARLLTVDQSRGMLTMELKNGKKLEEVPFTRFSAEDQQFIATCRDQKNEDDKITSVNGEDPEMNKAIREAQASFPAAWQKINADRKRDNPVYAQVMIKARFSDPPSASGEPEKPADGGKNPEADPDDDGVEHMWVADFVFDGKNITGILMNEPGRLKSVKKDERVTFPLERLTDWICVTTAGKIEGASTEKLLHRRMSSEEQKQHNEATGLDWGQ